MPHRKGKGMAEKREAQGASEGPDNVRDVIGYIRAECFMVCDGAQAVGGKLFILGGGWDRLMIGAFPLKHGLHLAVKLAIPAIDANQPLPLRVEVADENGRPPLEENGEPFQPLLGQLEVGRPAGYAANEDIPFLLTMGATLYIRAPERYTFTLYIRDRRVAQTSIRAIAQR